MIAVYPGTFDPLTKGHEDILLRSAKLFDHIIIAVAENPRKKTMITFKDRITLTQESFQNIPNIKVYGFTGMLIDFLKEHHATILIRCCRNITDAEYELSLQSIYKKTILILTYRTKESVSSTYNQTFYTMTTKLTRFTSMSIHIQILNKIPRFPI